MVVILIYCTNGINKVFLFCVSISKLIQKNINEFIVTVTKKDTKHVLKNI